MRVMAIIGIIWSVLSILCMGSVQEKAYTYSDSVDALAGWGYLGLIYALALAIVVVVQTSKSNTPKNTYGSIGSPNITGRLIELANLRQKGLLSNDEFEAIKLSILRK